MPEEGDMADDLAVAVARVDERVAALSETIQSMAETMKELAKDGSRIDSQQEQIITLFKAQDVLRGEIRRIEDKLIEHRQATARAASTGLWDTLKILIGAGVAAALAAKWGH